LPRFGKPRLRVPALAAPAGSGPEAAAASVAGHIDRDIRISGEAEIWAEAGPGAGHKTVIRKSETAYCAIRT